MSRWNRAVTTAAAALISVAVVVPGAQSSPRGPGLHDSLPQVSSGQLPGPAVLYEDPPELPVLENHHQAFVAPFDRVSGTERYVDGEYLYTDHLYDDHGASITYPTDRSRFGDNAADLVEFRISTRQPGVVHYRFTFNTLLDEDTTMAVVAFDTDRDDATGDADLPSRPGIAFPGTDAVLTAWGTGAQWAVNHGPGIWQVTDLPASVDLDANQITVAMATATPAPSGVWETTVATGLHDPATHRFRLPRATATETEPGGGEGKPGVFNVGFRFDEAILSQSAPPDRDQTAALTAGDISAYAHDVDFGALRAGVSSTSIPASGTTVRFFPSRLSLGEGRAPGFPAQIGPLQPYSLYVPTSYDPSGPTSLTLNLHSLGERHWQYNGSTGVQQLGEERGSLVATADARGTDGWYQDEAEYDVFEMWNDIAGHFTLDPDATAITGYSMGGYATYRLGTLYPDLFGAAATVVGPPGDGIWLGVGAPTGGAATLSNLWLENARNVPFMNIVAGADELVPITGTTQQNVGPAVSGRTSFDALGYRFAFDVYPAAEHLTLAILGYNLPQAAAYLGDAAIDRDPFHVTHAYVPASDNADLGLVHDHSYWVSDVRLADPTVGVAVSAASPPVGKGTIDIESLAFGVDDPSSTRGFDAGIVPLPYTEINRTWGAPLPRAAVNGFEVRLTNIAGATVDLPRARVVDTAPILVTLTADAPGALSLVAADGRTAAVSVLPGTGSVTVLPSDFS